LSTQGIDSDIHILKICGCPNDGKEELWTPLDLSEDDRFKFDTAYVLESSWCTTHGDEYCESILSLDDNYFMKFMRHLCR
jgi:hypothetical protein